MQPTLIIGNKNYSSWSLRPWLLLKVSGIPFNEIKVPLYREDSREKLLEYSPSGKVPALQYDHITCWDSLAICEFIADQYPGLNLWPQDPGMKALARSITNEMHSGFFEIRNLLPMNCRARTNVKQISPKLQGEIDRVCAIWNDCRSRYGADGNFLFGPFTIADAMYAPVATRFITYGIKFGKPEGQYVDTILSLPAMQEWLAEAAAEKEVIQEYEIKTP